MLSLPLRWLFLKSRWEGAQTSIYCAVSEGIEGRSGEFFSNCKALKLANPQATDDDVAKRLWQVSAQLVGLEDKEEN